jgi:hypothetical protein
MAKNFFGVNLEGLEVDHIDGNKLNNVLTNLEVVTSHENTMRAYHSGLQPEGTGYFPKKIKNLETGDVYDSANDAARAMGVSRGRMSVAARRHQRVRGQRFEYVD